MRKLLVLIPVLLVAGCVSGGPTSSTCGHGDGATRLTAEQIDLLTDKQVYEILGRNEAQAARGCAVPNK